MRLHVSQNDVTVAADSKSIILLLQNIANKNKLKLISDESLLWFLMRFQFFNCNRPLLFSKQLVSVPLLPWFKAVSVKCY